MTISDFLRALAFVAFVLAAILAFGVFTWSSQYAVPLAWVATGLALWVASTFAAAGRELV